MAFIVKCVKTVRNHWKKSTVAASALVYGYNYTQEYFQIQELMRAYCEMATKYGDQPIPVQLEPRNITVILNPSANKRKASDEFDKYCAPILHLAGICVNVLKTESEGHAKTLMSDINNTDAIVIAGGDGTISEVITGLLRRTNENAEALIPLGVLPLGRTNSLIQDMHPFGKKVDKVRALAESTLAVVEECVRPLNVLKVELLESDENKPIYAVAGVKWGAFRDAESKKDSYWVYGRFRNYVTYLFNGYKNSLSWNCSASVDYSPPCAGCSNCVRNQNDQKHWFQRLSKNKSMQNAHIINPECSLKQSKDVKTCDLTLSIAKKSNTPKLEVKIGPENINYLTFVSEGWKSENGKNRNISQTIEARSVEIRPKVKDNTWLSIDNENYELKPIRVTLLPNLLKIFWRKPQDNNAL